MTKISFCGISGSGMSALAQIRLHQGYEVRGSDRSFDQGKDQSNKQALEKLGIKIYPQDGSAITDDLDVLYVSTAVEDTIPDVKAALGNCRTVLRIDFNAELFQGLFVALVFALVKTAVGAANLIALMQANLRQRTHSAARDAAKTDFSHCYSPF